MQVYTVHEAPNAPADRLERAEQLVFVRDGFACWALLFGPFWLLAKRLWLAGIIALVVSFAVAGGMAAIGFDEDTAGLAGFVINLLIAFEGSSLHRWTLERRGWTLVGTATGKSRTDSERRFFESWLPNEPLMRSRGEARESGFLPLPNRLPWRTPWQSGGRLG